MARGGLFTACMSSSSARGVGTSYGAAGSGRDRAPDGPAALEELREETTREAALNEVFRKEFAREQRRLQRDVEDVVDAAKRGGMGGGMGGGGGRARAGSARWSGCATVAATALIACVAALAALAYVNGVDSVVALTNAPVAQSRGERGGRSVRGQHQAQRPIAARRQQELQRSREEVRDLHRRLDQMAEREETLEGSLNPWALTEPLTPDPPRLLRDEDEATWKAREKAEAEAKNGAKDAEKIEKIEKPPAKAAAKAPRRAGGGKPSAR